MFESLDPPPLEPGVKFALILWVLLLIVWPIALMGAGMAGEGHRHPNQLANLTLVWSVLLYPVLVFVAFLFRRMEPRLVSLPGLSFFVGFIAACLI